MNFYIMNKDIKVLLFSIDTICGVTNIVVHNVFRQDLIPLSLRATGSLQKWIDDRLILSHRSNVTRLFSSLGIYTLEDKISCTHCISLLDTYWVKSESDRLNWKSVSPYRNSFNEIISRYSMDSSFVGGKNIGHSPDFSLGGSFPKCWRKVNGDIYLYKSGTTGAFNSGNEPYSEVLASNLSSYLGFNHVDYELMTYRSMLTTRCKNLCSEDIGMYTVDELYPKVVSYEDIFNIISTSNKSVMQLFQILMLDYLTINVDRHFSNISFLVSNDTQRILGLAPIYDNNLAFLPYFSEKLDTNVENYLSREGSVYNYTKIGQSFEDLLLFLYRLNSSLVKSALLKARGYKFSRGIKRSEVANIVLGIQVSKAYRLLSIEER